MLPTHKHHPIQLPLTFDGMNYYALWGWRQYFADHDYNGCNRDVLAQIEAAYEKLSPHDRMMYLRLNPARKCIVELKIK